MTEAKTFLFCRALQTAVEMCGLMNMNMNMNMKMKMKMDTDMDMEQMGTVEVDGHGWMPLCVITRRRMKMRTRAAAWRQEDSVGVALVDARRWAAAILPMPLVSTERSGGACEADYHWI